MTMTDQEMKAITDQEGPNAGLLASPMEKEVKGDEMEPELAAAASGQPQGKETEISAAAALTSMVDSSGLHDDEDEDDEEHHDGKEFKIPTRFTKSGRRRATPFPLKLMKVLSQKEFKDIIAWTPSGKAFNILLPKVFVAEILPEHFKSAKYSSFTRKLHRWGFMRHYRGEEAGAFFHKHFQKGRMDLVEKMTCYKAPQPVKPAFSPRTVPEGMDMSMGSVQGPTPMVGSAMAAAANMQNQQLAGPTPFNMAAMQQQFQMQQQALMQQNFMQQQLQLQQQNQAMQQQQNQMQQQQQNQIQQQQQQPQEQGQNQPQASSDQRQDLNAAIEMEVARRLKERINAAALSRQALAMMQPSQQNGMDNRFNNFFPQQGMPTGQTGMGAQGMNQQGLSLNTGAQGNNAPVNNNGNDTNMNGNNFGNQGVMGSYKPFEPAPMNFNPYATAGADMNNHFAPGMAPNSNIQGAKTA